MCEWHAPKFKFRLKMGPGGPVFVYGPQHGSQWALKANLGAPCFAPCNFATMCEPHIIVVHPWLSLACLVSMFGLAINSLLGAPSSQGAARTWVGSRRIVLHLKGLGHPLSTSRALGVDVWQWWPNTMTTNFNLIGKE